MVGFRDVSLQRKLKWITALATTAALLIACAAIVSYDFFSFRRIMVRDVQTLAKVTAENCKLPLRLGENYKKDTTGYLAAFEAEPRIVAACLFDKSALEFSRYVREGGTFSAPAAQSRGHRFTGNRLQVFFPIIADDEYLGTLYIESDLNELHARLRAYAGFVALVLVLALAGAVALSSRLQKVISEPVLRLAETVRVVSKERDYSVRAQKIANDELGVLTDGFNEMLGQIEERDDALRSARDQLEKRVEERTAELQLEILDRTHAESVVQQQLAHISLLNQITHAISEKQDVQSILSIVLQQLEEHLEIRCGAFYLFREEQAAFDLAAVRGLRQEDEDRFFISEFSLATLARSSMRACVAGQAVYISDADDAFIPFTVHKDPQQTQSWVALPLLVENKLFGLLITGRPAAIAFSARECEFLKMLSEQVALAGYQAHLYSELQAAYNELRETQQAAMQHERLRALGQLASGIAHDINNALSPVAGFAELLLISEPGLSPMSGRYLQHIRTAAEDIGHIVSRLREFYRQRDDADELAHIDVNQIVKQAIDLTRPRWKDISQQQGIHINVVMNCQEHLPPLLGLESEVREALTNLVFNAVDAVANEGTIKISTRVRNSSERTSSELIIEVQDNGMGMDVETRKRCLEPFFSTKGVHGTGLGLAMVYGIMERHEGWIEIESERGQGTTMRLVFPVRVPAETNNMPIATTVEPIQPLRILYVDDEPLLRQLIRSLLEHDDHEVVVADGGPSGLAAFQRASAEGKPFEVVITDLGMPHMDGRKLSQSIRAGSPETPIIMLTGWGTLMRSEDETLVDCVLSKPPKINELRGALRRVMTESDVVL
jgi:signal transduction histidine kinase/ActR/RegA family two-component response regulator